MPVAYVTTPASAVKADALSLTITRDGRTIGSIELIHLSALVLIGRIAITAPALYLLLRHNIPLLLMSRTGRVRGRLVPFQGAAVTRRLAQAAIARDHARRITLARRIVFSKIHAMRTVLRRFASNHPDDIPEHLRTRLDATLDAIQHAPSIPKLLGHEGAAAAAYWKAFTLMNRSDLPFNGRTRRPPRDPVNALLSFAYALLLAEFTVALEAASLDPYIGVYHETNDRRPALALDLMEPFRHAVADRLVLRMINRRQITREHFNTRNNGWWLTRQGVRTFLPAFEEMLTERPDPCLIPRNEEETITDIRRAMHRRVELLAQWLDRNGPHTPEHARHAA